MHAGNNYGYIHIVSYTQHLKINVSVICKKADESEDFEVRTEEKLARYKLTKLYLDFRMKKIKKEKWIAESMGQIYFMILCRYNCLWRPEERKQQHRYIIISRKI